MSRYRYPAAQACMHPSTEEAIVTVTVASGEMPTADFVDPSRGRVTAVAVRRLR